MTKYDFSLIRFFFLQFSIKYLKIQLFLKLFQNFSNVKNVKFKFSLLQFSIIYFSISNFQIFWLLDFQIFWLFDFQFFWLFDLSKFDWSISNIEYSSIFTPTFLNKFDCLFFDNLIVRFCRDFPFSTTWVNILDITRQKKSDFHLFSARNMEKKSYFSQIF